MKSGARIRRSMHSKTESECKAGGFVNYFEIRIAEYAAFYFWLILRSTN